MSLTRRRLLGLGGIGALGLSLPQLLRADAQRPDRSGKSCIVIYQYGGLSQLDSWDPKPGAPVELRGPYRPIATKVPGFQVGELMPRLAELADRYAVIRSMTHKVAIHDQANRMLLAGDTSPALDAPALGSIVTRLRPVSAGVPPYVWLQKFGGGAAPPDRSYLTGGFLGANHAPMVIGERHDDHPAAADFRVRAFDPNPAIGPERLAERRALLSRLRSRETSIFGRPSLDEAPPAATHDSPATPAPPNDELAAFQQRAFDLLAGGAAREAFDIAREPSATRERYGRHPLGQNLLLARRLIEAGVRLVGVVAWTGLAPGEEFVSVETWDMHGNAGVGIFDDGWNGLGFALPRADQAVAALLEDLEQRGLLDTTLVVLAGEFGRTPTISRGAGAIGRDHWPDCYSAMLAGAGIQGGAVIGESDSHAAYVRSRPVSPQDFGATILAALGIDPQERISPDGFTSPASRGEPIRELL